MQKIFSHGKLLITSEYLVLDSALALAVPTKLGQEFFFEEKKDAQSIIFWESYCQGNLWLKIKINYQNWNIIETNNIPSAEFILKVLKEIQQLSDYQLQENHSYFLKSNIQFPKNFGLGSSSTLMTNLAKWAKINAFELNENILGGSGYDIAVAQKSSAILYQLHENQRYIEEIQFSPEFKKDLIFIHLNQKQNSREGISLYRSKEKPKVLIQKFSELTSEIINCSSIEKFSELMTLHETQLSKLLGLKTVKESHFSDCPVFVKSLGAWGGDFVMSRKFDGYQDYFNHKGFKTIFNWNQMIL